MSALDGYVRERTGLLHRIARLRSVDPDTRLVVKPGLPCADLPDNAIGVVGPTIGDLLADAQATLEQIDREIDRLKGAA